MKKKETGSKCVRRYADILYKEGGTDLVLKVRTMPVGEDDSAQDLLSHLFRIGSPWDRRRIVDVDFFAVDKKGLVGRRRYVGNQGFLF